MTRSHPEEKNEKGCEKEREGSPVPIFPPLRFRIVRIFPGSVSFCFHVSALWGKRGCPYIELKRVLYRIWGVANDWFLSSGRGFYPL